MPIFVCDDCGCMENTALGLYWGRNLIDGRALCSECAPTEFNDGSKTGLGKWHGEFQKRQWDGKRQVINR